MTPAAREFPLEPGDTRRLTYNLGPDVSPVWTPDGRAVSYVAEALPPAGAGEWLRAQVPAEGGVATIELPEYGNPATLELLPLYRAGGGTVGALAYLERLVSCPCGLNDQLGAQAIFVAEVPLDQPPRSVTSLRQTRVLLPGLYQIIYGTFVNTYRIVMLPAYHRRRADFANPFGPSWAPDGSNLAIATGESLFVWTPGDSAATAVPGVSDAAFPRFSPDGQWIAFTRYPRDSVTTRSCFFAFAVGGCTNDFTIYYAFAPDVWIVRPDGSDLTRITAGEETAWLPDGTALLVKRPGGLAVVGVDGVERGFLAVGEVSEPAVSPDGRRVVYVSRAGGGNLDLWTLDLSP